MKSEKHPKVEEEVLKRLNIALDFLLQTEGLNQRSIALRMKIHHTNLYRVAAGKRPLTSTFAVNFEHHTNISSVWLTTGEGDMIKTDVEIFSDEEIRFFYKIKKDAKLYELVKLLAEVKKDSYELLKGLILKLIK
ncbi:hypothetical protein [Leptospira mayottensis]|uniref:hypothetical protein n=1 Tax=Leptospira mayottensis TaxID=1137606 RepID=UPI0015759B5D|nr:hypothetical protein [Leptospira mayottensis]